MKKTVCLCLSNITYNVVNIYTSKTLSNHRIDNYALSPPKLNKPSYISMLKIWTPMLRIDYIDLQTHMQL
jgi:hypothetical protein